MSQDDEARAESPRNLSHCPQCGQPICAAQRPPGESAVCSGCGAVFAGPSEATNRLAEAQPTTPLPRPATLQCGCCGSTLEVSAEVAGKPARCPTCGIQFEVPAIEELLAARGGRIEVGRPADAAMPVHAYAAAGELAPQIVRGDSGSPAIQCGRCKRISPVEADICQWCGAPFAIESGTRVGGNPLGGWRAASVVVGLTSIVAFRMPVVAAAAMVCGLFAVRGLPSESPAPQRVMAWSGVVLGGLSLLFLLAMLLHNL